MNEADARRCNKRSHLCEGFQHTPWCGRIRVSRRHGMNTRELLATKRDEMIRIAAAHGARNLRLFGSIARGDETEASDVDILVTLDPGTGLLAHAALARELQELLQRRVDVVSDRALRQRVRERVLKEALPL